MLHKFGFGLTVFLFLLAAAVPAAKADTLLFQGNLTRADEVQLFNFTVVTSSGVTIRTLSYAGGMSGSTMVARGGFDPLIALFNSSGVRLTWNDDSSIVPADPVTDAQFDSYLNFPSLAVGNYILGLAQAGNEPRGTLAAGFGFFPGDERTDFTDVKTFPPNPRDSHYAVEITGAGVRPFVPSAEPIPEPATLLLLGSGLAGLAARVYRRNRRGEEA